LVNCGGLSPEESKKVIFSASEAGDLEMVKKIVSNDSTLACLGNKLREKTPLHVAGSAEVAEYLISQGCDPNSKDRFKWTPLHFVKNLDAAQVLINNGADLQAQNVKKQTPIYTTQSGDVAQLLINGGVSINKATSEHFPYKTPLFFAVTKGHPEVARVLLNNGANSGLRTNKKETYLHLAAKNGKADVIEILLESGMYIDETAEHQATPLHYAALQNRLEAVQVLLEKGAFVNATLSKGAAIHTFQTQRVGAYINRPKGAGGAGPIEITTSQAIKNLLIEHGATQ